MHCPDIVELERFATESLSPESAASLASHLRECPACADRLVEIKANLTAAAPISGILRDTGVLAELGPGARFVEGFRILREIGRGGSGVVFEAEQASPRRAVALKLLRRSPNDNDARHFRREVAALARLDHPGIAALHAAGETPDGDRFLAMELVRGLPLNAYASERTLTIRARLELFADACDAVAFAHGRGVIHRDLKPSNILVARPDPAGPGVPKVIDFGVAKAAQPDEAGAAAVTRGHEFLGTPAYMSPEQAGLAGRDVDTRADIYAMGVLLHELLTGRTPLDGRALAAAGLEETLRRIREEEPARASAVLERLPPDEQAAVARARRTEPRALRAALRDDLDWIILRCLEKDRARRYDSAAALAADLRRHLADEPVAAAAPGVGYRLGKFFRRHRLAVGAAAFAALVLLAATAVSLALAWRATQAEELAQRLLGQEQRRRTELEELRRRADDEAARARTEAATARAVSRFFGDEVLARADPTREPERELTLRSVLDRASLRLETSLTNEPAVAAAIHETLARAYQNLALHAAAARHWAAARDLFTTARGPEAEETLRAVIEFAFVSHRAGDREHALPLAEQAVATARARFGRLHPLALHGGNRLAWLYYMRGRLEDWHREAEETYRDLLAAEMPEDTDLLGVTYLVARKRGRRDGGVFEEGEAILLDALAQMRARRGEEHSLTLLIKNQLAVYYYDHGRHFDRAEALYREVLEHDRSTFGETHEQTLATMSNLGLLYTRAGRPEAAQWAYFQVLRHRPDDAGARRDLLRLLVAAPPPAYPLEGDPPWRGTATEPPARWNFAGFDAAAWPLEADSPTGPGWWRAAFTLPIAPLEPLVVVVAGVAQGELFFNGVPAGPGLGAGDGAGLRFVLATSDATRVLRAGSNVVALRLLEAGTNAPVRVTLHAFPAAPGSWHEAR